MKNLLIAAEIVAALVADLRVHYPHFLRRLLDDSTHELQRFTALPSEVCATSVFRAPPGPFPWLGPHEELELVAVRVLEEDLLGAVGAAGGTEFDALPLQELGGFADVVDPHGKMAGTGTFV